jgi:site-specific DNA recombinase
VIQLIYQKIALEDISTRALASYLEERFPPPGRYKHWEPRQIALFIRNPIYKGQFAAGRFQEVKMPAKKQRPHERLKLVIKRIERPPNEWIIVPVPAIVSDELWKQANLALERKAHLSRRNGQDPFLLTGLLKCDVCGCSFVGGRKRNTTKDGALRLFRYYRCTARAYRTPAVAAEIGCTQRTINAELLDVTVWHYICHALLEEPVALVAKLDKKLFNEGNLLLRTQIEFLQRCIREKDQEDSKLYNAYVAGIFETQEYATRRAQVMESKQKLAQELGILEKQQVTQEQILELQTLVANLADQIAVRKDKVDVPFATKQRIVRLLIQQILLNVAEQRLQMDGVISGTFPLLSA